MANLIQATVYQIDGSPLPSVITLDFQTSNLVIREASIVGTSAVNSAILYYNLPNNQLSVQTFYVGESIAELVAAANVGSTTQLQATVLEINEDPQVPGGVQYSFPANEILIGPGTESYIQFKNVRYSVLEKQSDLLVSGNGASAYKVYTALLTQSGGDDPQDIFSGNLTVGVTYQIFDDGGASGYDFTNVGAPNNDLYTRFVATGTTPNSWGTNTGLSYNTGAPVVTVLENTIGNIWFTYAGNINSQNLFPVGKTVAFLQLNTAVSAPNGTLYSLIHYYGSAIVFAWYDPITDTSGTPPLNTPIEIRVYN
jgi:hypothetical protein